MFYSCIAMINYSDMVWWGSCLDHHSAVQLRGLEQCEALGHHVARNKPVTIPEVLTELCTVCAKLQIITGVSGRFQRVGCKKRAKAEAATKRDALPHLHNGCRTVERRSASVAWRGVRRARCLLVGSISIRREIHTGSLSQMCGWSWALFKYFILYLNCQITAEYRTGPSLCFVYQSQKSFEDLRVWWILMWWVMSQ